MKNASIIVVVLSILLVGCANHQSKGSNNDSVVGSDKDKHGCIGSAGYSWCARSKKCERPWELAEKIGFANTPGDFEEYCGE